MSQLHVNFGTGQRSGTVELEVVTRMLSGLIYDTEEIRMDKPTNYADGFEYYGLAENGSSIYDPVWNCIRRQWINNRCVRMQFTPNIIWNNRCAGWL